MRKLPARLQYSSFVLEKEKILYIETPKVACSSVKSLLRHCYPSSVGHDFYFKDQSSIGMNVHSRSMHSTRSLYDLDPEEVEEVFTSPDWLRFCIIRNPFDRLFSCWRDKVYLHEPGFIRNHKKLLDSLGESSNHISNFRMFVDWVVAGRSSNYHWEPMSSLLYPDLIQYSLVVRLENIANEIKPFLDRMGYSSGQFGEFYKNNSIPVPRGAYYDEETANAVYKYYKEDFSRYGYSLDAWQHIGLAERYNTLDLSSHDIGLSRYSLFINSIRERNQVIAKLNQQIIE